MPLQMREDSFSSSYVYSFRADTILKFLKYASPKPIAPATIELGESSKFRKGVIHLDDTDDADVGPQDADEEKPQEQGPVVDVVEEKMEQQQINTPQAVEETMQQHQETVQDRMEQQKTYSPKKDDTESLDHVEQPLDQAVDKQKMVVKNMFYMYN